MGYLFIHNFYALFYGHYFDNTEHKHHAIQWCSATKGDLVLSFNEQKETGKSFIIAPDTPHKLIHGEGELFILFLDSDTVAGKAIMKKYLKSKSYIMNNLPGLSDFQNEYPSASELKMVVKHLFESLDEDNMKPFDPRILRILDIIKYNQLKDITIPQLAADIGLSESRLQHLFKENIGIPIRSFLLWKRIGRAVQLIQETNDLTTIAYDAGFSDSAHFSRSFRQMFGVSPREIFKSLGSIEVVFID